MSSTDAIIRRALTSDAERLSAFAERTFRETFSDTNTAEDMNLYCAGAFSPAIQRAEIEDDAADTYLVEHNGELVAYAHLCSGPAEDGIRGGLPIELKRFYVAREYHGTGVARDLMRHVIDEAREAGADPLWLGVWERNPRAIRFYVKHGFVEVGEHHFVVGTDRQRDVLMVRK
jgi:GNAT superfamily N-acetyltransferase